MHTMRTAAVTAANKSSQTGISDRTSSSHAINAHSKRVDIRAYKQTRSDIELQTVKPRFISRTFHGIIDYAAALALITAPFILHLGNTSAAAIWLSVATGIAVVLVSILTKYRYALFRVIPFDLHLAIDLAAATAFVGIPFVFSFTGIDAAYYTINAAVLYLVVALTENRPTLIA